MKKEFEVTRRRRSWEAINHQLSPASLPPYWSPQKGEGELMTGDRHYFMHGEVIAFTAITIFVIFLLFLLIPFIRRATSSTTATSTAEEYSGSGKRKNYLLLMLRKKRCELETSSVEPSDENYGLHQRWNSL